MFYVVMVRCPNTDKAVSTGVHCDIKTFIDLAERISLNCPECGHVHYWTTEDAWLRDTFFATGEVEERYAQES
jgi:hypothetical protein